MLLLAHADTWFTSVVILSEVTCTTKLFYTLFVSLDLYRQHYAGVNQPVVLFFIYKDKTEDHVRLTVLSGLSCLVGVVGEILKRIVQF